MRSSQIGSSVGWLAMSDSSSAVTPSSSPLSNACRATIWVAWLRKRVQPLGLPGQQSVIRQTVVRGCLPSHEQVAQRPTVGRAERRIELSSIHLCLEAVSLRSGLDRIRWQLPPKSCDVGLQRLDRARRRLTAPERVDECVHRHGVPRSGGEHGEQSSGQRTGDGNRLVPSTETSSGPSTLTRTCAMTARLLALERRRRASTRAFPPAHVRTRATAAWARHTAACRRARSMNVVISPVALA